MKKRHLLPALLVCGLVSSLRAQLLQYNFNQGSGNAVNSGSVGASANLGFGATAGWGADGSGVGGGSGNYSYSGIYSNPEGGTSYAVTASTVTALNGLTQMTITGWINTTDWETGGAHYIASYYAGTWPNGFWLATDTPGGTTTGQLALNLGNNGDTPSTGGHFDDYSGQWMFFAASWDSVAGTISYYYGTESLTATLDSTVNDNGVNAIGDAGVPFYVGNSNGHPWWEAVNGGLDDIRVYGSALDAGQIENVRSSALVPEPGSATLLLIGCAGFWLSSKRSRRSPARA